MPDPLQVERHELLSMGVGQRVVGAQLLHEAAIPGELVVSSHDVVERPVGTATLGETDDQVASMVGLVEESSELDHDAA
ncbi:hypothetical protein MDA_GLEAN10001115 [Myotis davidii]|uniref:Uncharacterized protein n=1 Tax=Myotis davidii TaxID=225400 RepID=L5M331_MYODS|nr:hypothetical protein MDA_GLEAN10001115 [Myotis davidii]